MSHDDTLPRVELLKAIAFGKMGSDADGPARLGLEADKEAVVCQSAEAGVEVKRLLATQGNAGMLATDGAQAPEMLQKSGVCQFMSERKAWSPSTLSQASVMSRRVSSP